jgi:hypothetical protein
MQRVLCVFFVAPPLPRMENRVMYSGAALPALVAGLFILVCIRLKM